VVKDMGVESLKHSFAKNALAQWLRETTNDYDFYGLPPLSWRPNRANAGVLVEYPVCIDSENKLVGLDPVWDERTSDLDKWGNGYVPSYDECIKESLLPICIFDVAIQHKGNIIYGLEVVHRNPVSTLKKQYLERINREASCRIDVFQIDADWILNQVKKPKTLKISRVI
jgi:hypothetical protein